MGRTRNHAGMFLARVKVKRFARVQKKWDRVGEWSGLRANIRRIETVENKRPDDVFTVVGVSTIPLGYGEYLSSDEGYAFVQTGSRQVYIVAKSIGQRFKILAEDIEVIERGPDE